MLDVYMLCGLPGSGKTTWVQKHLESHKGIVINQDGLRTMMYAGKYVYDQQMQPYINDVVFYAAVRALQLGNNLIVDATSAVRTKRANWIKKLRAESNIDFLCTCIYCYENKRNLELRLREPRGLDTKVWHEAIEKIRGAFEEPAVEDGFDFLFRVGVP